MKRFVAVLCLATSLLLAAVAPPASAGTKTIWPNQFTPVEGATGEGSLAGASNSARRAFNFIATTPASRASFDSEEIKLPVGARITRLSVSAGSGSPGEISAYLSRIRFGALSEAVAWIELSGVIVRGVYTTDTIVLPRVEAGYKYWVRVEIQNAGSVSGVQVSYR
jgi:hypothetical protein